MKTDWNNALQNQFADENSAYRQQISEFNQNGLKEINEKRNKQMRGILTAASLALDAGNGMTPVTALSALSNDISDGQNEYVGSMFRGKGAKARFCVFTRDQDGRPRIAKEYTIPELYQASNSIGGGIFSAANDSMMRGVLEKSMTPQQIDAAIGPRIDPDSLKANMTGGAGGRQIGGEAVIKGVAARALFGRGDSRSRISVFGTDGNGGYMNRDYDGHTGEDTGAVYGGKWADGSNGNWKVTMSGPRLVKEAHTDEKGKRVEAQYESGKMYENSKTREEIWVPAGSSLRQVMANAEGAARGRYGLSGRSAEDQIAIDAAKHGNKMEELRLQEEGKNTRSAAKRDFDQKKLNATIKKWGDDLKVREKSAKTAEDKAALEKSRAQYNDFSKRIGVLSNVVNTPGVPKAVKDKARELLAGALDDDGMPNYAAISDEDNQAPIKPSDNSGGKTVTGYRYNKDRTKRIPVYSDGSQGEVEDAK